MSALRDANAKAVGQRVAARSHDQVAHLEAVGRLNPIAVAQSDLDVLAMRAAVGADYKHVVFVDALILKQRGGWNYDRVGRARRLDAHLNRRARLRDSLRAR